MAISPSPSSSSSSSSSSSPCNSILTSTKYDVYCSNVTMVCLVVGVALTLTAFFYPVEWDFIDLDPSKTAQENEERRAQQVREQTAVYIMSLAGVILVTIGGILSSFLLTKYILLEECVKTVEDGQNNGLVTSPPCGNSSPYSVMPDRSSGGIGENSGGDGTARKEKKNTDVMGDGQKRKLVDSDHLELNGASQLYGSTT